MTIGMRAGALQRIITIQQPVTTNGVTRWVNLMTGVPAEIVPQSGAEIVRGQGAAPNVLQSLINIRYRAGIRPKMRVLYKARVLEIVSVINVDEDGQILTLVVKEAVS